MPKGGKRAGGGGGRGGKGRGGKRRARGGRGASTASPSESAFPIDLAMWVRAAVLRGESVKRYWEAVAICVVTCL